MKLARHKFPGKKTRQTTSVSENQENFREPPSRPLTVFFSTLGLVLRSNPKKNMHDVWDPNPGLNITSPYVYSRVDSNSFTMGIGRATLCQSRP